MSEQLETQIRALTEQLRDARTLVADQEQTILSLQKRLIDVEESAQKAHLALQGQKIYKHNQEWWGQNAEDLAATLRDLLGGLTEWEAKKRLCEKRRGMNSVHETSFNHAWKAREQYLKALSKSRPRLSGLSSWSTGLSGWSNGVPLGPEDVPK